MVRLAQCMRRTGVSARAGAVPAARLSNAGMASHARRPMSGAPMSGAPAQPSEWVDSFPWGPGELRPAPFAPAVIIPHELKLTAPDFSMEGQFRQPNTREDLDGLRAAGAVAAAVLDEACKAVAPGVTTEEIDAVAHAACLNYGAWPTGLGFRGFPKSCCTSVNEVVCHGIPDSRPLEDGDLITIDCVAFLDGYHGDNARTVGVGTVPDESAALARVCLESIEKAIEIVGPGVNYHDLATTIFEYADAHGYSVIREYGGHGIGRSLHMPPVISFHPLSMSRQYVMEVGHCFTIEPMIVQGSNEIQLWGDGWTVVTRDGSRAAQYEHMVVVTEDGAEVLTRTELCDQAAF